MRTRIHRATHIIVTADECEVQRVCHAGEEDVNLAERENALKAAQHEVFNGKRLHLLAILFATHRHHSLSSTLIDLVDRQCVARDDGQLQHRRLPWDARQGLLLDLHVHVVDIGKHLALLEGRLLGEARLEFRVQG